MVVHVFAPFRENINIHADRASPPTPQRGSANVPRTPSKSQTTTPEAAFIRREPAHQATCETIFDPSAVVDEKCHLPLPACLPGEAENHAGAGGEEGELFSVDTLVTVVDSTTFMNEVREADYLDERGMEADEGDTRTIADLLVAQASRRRTARRVR